jgi:hypothetical protein
MPAAPGRLDGPAKTFDRASESGLFDGRRVELIDGELLEVPPMNDPQAQGVQLAPYALLPKQRRDFHATLVSAVEGGADVLMNDADYASIRKASRSAIARREGK